MCQPHTEAREKFFRHSFQYDRCAGVADRCSIECCHSFEWSSDLVESEDYRIGPPSSQMQTRELLWSILISAYQCFSMMGKKDLFILLPMLEQKKKTNIGVFAMKC